GGVLALLLGDVLHRDVVLQPEPLGNAEARRSGSAVNEHGGLGRAADGFRLVAVGEGHGTVLSGWFVSLAKASWFANTSGRASLIKRAMCCAPASACAASEPAIAAKSVSDLCWLSLKLPSTSSTVISRPTIAFFNASRRPAVIFDDSHGFFGSSRSSNLALSVSICSASSSPDIARTGPLRCTTW